MQLQALVVEPERQRPLKWDERIDASQLEMVLLELLNAGAVGKPFFLGNLRYQRLVFQGSLKFPDITPFTDHLQKLADPHFPLM